MFVLEESQLIEDTISNESLLKLYKQLKENESSNNLDLLLNLTCDEKFERFCKIIFSLHQSNQIDSKLSPEEKEELYQQLRLEKNDAVSLALIVAATFTQLFVIENFTGPKCDNLESKLSEILLQFQNKFDFRSLTSDGSEVYHLVSSPWLLRGAQLVWNFLNNFGVSRRLLELEFLVWKHRYLTVHLMILHEPSEVIVNELRKIQEFIFDHHILNDARENKTQLVRFNTVELCCELIQSALLRDGITSCRKIFDFASEVSGITIEHTGVLGRRTRFQQADIPQLVIRVNRTNEQQTTVTEVVDKTKIELPKDIQLDDDTLLPDVKFIQKDDQSEYVDNEHDASTEAQLIMLAKLDYILKTEVMEESLKDEWTLAYVRTIINSSTIWSVKYKALSMRSAVEKKHMRKMDRALLQLEELIKESTERCDTKELAKMRMKSLYAALPLSVWQMQRSLGDISFDLGLSKNALEMYSKIEYWEGIIKCYNSLGETSKAEKVIRQELAKEETPYLYCLLGDATENIEHYETSWKLSNRRFARAKKSIGTHYYLRKQYAEAIEHYELALEASPSNMSIVSLLAYSCLLLERYERAAECYRHITYLDDTNFLAWNNLSKAYIKLNQKERAWRTLRQAIKCNYEEWKIWENFMLVAIEIGALDDVITAWHRLIDIKSSHKDDQVLSALTYSLIKRSYGKKSEAEFMKLFGDALKLVARVTTTSASSPIAWMCYFRLLARDFELTLINLKGEEMPRLDFDSRVSKMTNALQRATPITIVANPDWFRSTETIVEVLDRLDELLDCYLLSLDILGAKREIGKQWQSFKLSINNVLKKLREIGYAKTE